MIRVRQAIVVEGRYDKNTLSQIVDAPIFETDGFGVLSDRAKLELLRRVAEKRGLIILTDGDGAGFVIRNYLKGALPREQVLHAYIPDIPGKERRKAHPGREGKLGVEGMSPEVLIGALRACGAELDGESFPAKQELTRLDLYELGLSGGAGSSEKRKRLLRKLGLPERMSSTAMYEAVRLLYDRGEFIRICEETL